MKTSLKTIFVRESLEQIQALVEQLRGQYVHGIKGPADYKRATLLLDELTDGHILNRYEEQILVEVEEAILDYEQGDATFSRFSAEAQAAATPIQLLKDLMEIHTLSGSDLPEIGDKTAISKVLNGERPISHKKAFALAERFGIDPKAFVAAQVRASAKTSSIAVTM
ncbi:transcriptional regulator [Pseudomonas sp. hsmgli-8]|uniref:Transcriptional regulator n=1 Tax=Pseudomonas quercus TaxID=2722792 RepID=A0ABX0YAB9_9PSED|nr:transcriptional regulator [Pseudomonas sp. LY10J]NJP00271.1 transcriptional regulator [Pseudomonas quercus]